MRHYRKTDRLLASFDQALRAIVPNATQAERPLPVATPEPVRLGIDESRKVAGLMRINHTGEVCAQALYHGQAFTAKLPKVRLEMEQAGKEEADHLAWCNTRLNELGAYPSILNPIWYGLSFGIGAIAGIAGDKYSLGFVAETEKQVSLHLTSHLKQLPIHDTRSQAILEQMNIDELKHRDTALQAGGAELPLPIRLSMKLMSKVMTNVCYYV